MRLAYCIGTSYSIEISVLLQIALSSSRALRTDELLDRAIGGFDEPRKQALNGAEMANVLAVLHDFAGKSAIFCQSCRIQIPDNLRQEGASTRSRVFSLLDACLQVVSPTSDHSAFHPKLWLIHFDSTEVPGLKEWRLVLTSRNLTKANTWEVQACLSGRQGKGRSLEGLEVVLKELRRLSGMRQDPATARKHTRLIDRALADLKLVVFELPPGFDKARLLWRSGIGTDGLRVLKMERYSRVIAMSPFLRKTPMQNLRPDKDLLITGPKDLCVLNDFPELVNSKGAVLFSLPGKDNNIDLHAKLYLCRRDDGSGTDVYLGSANLTNAAMGGPNSAANTECLIHLTSQRDLVSEFEKDFVFQSQKDNRFSNWLRVIGQEDVEASELEEQKEQEKKKLGSVRDQIGRGSFVLKGSQNVWMLEWQGDLGPVPEGLAATGQVLGNTAEFDLLGVLKSKESLPLLELSQPSAFLLIKLGLPDLPHLEFATEMEVIGRPSTRLQDIMKLVAEESSFADMLTSIFPESGIMLQSSAGKTIDPKLKRSTGDMVGIGLKGYLEVLLLADHTDEYKIELMV